MQGGHEYAIGRWIQQETDDAVQVEEGSLYPALYRLGRKGLVRAEWGLSELERRPNMFLLPVERLRGPPS